MRKSLVLVWLFASVALGQATPTPVPYAINGFGKIPTVFVNCVVPPTLTPTPTITPTPVPRVSKVGSVLMYDTTLNNGSTTITVPATTTFMVVGMAGQRDPGGPLEFSGGTYSLDGSTLTMIRAEDADQAYFHSALFYLKNPTVGASKTFIYDFEGTNPPFVGVTIFFAFFKDVNLTSPIRSHGGQYDSDASFTTGSMNAADGDYIVLASCSGNANTWRNWTNITELIYNHYNNVYEMWCENSSPTEATTVSMTQNNGWASISGCVIGKQ